MHPRTAYRIFAFLVLVLVVKLALIHGAVADSSCPLAERCPFYKKIKEGGATNIEINWEDTKCPLEGKCPYFAELKKRLEEGGKIDESAFKDGCPFVEKCPHFKKDGERAHGSPDECPYLSKIKDKTGGEIKCPHLQRLAKEAAEGKHDEL